MAPTVVAALTLPCVCRGSFLKMRVWVTIGLLTSGCAAPLRSVPPALDPANPDAEEQPVAARQLSPLVPPAPPEVSAEASGAHDLAGMNMPRATEPAADAGHDMGAMKMPEEGSMAGMRMPGDLGAARSGEVHLMGVVTRIEGTLLIATLEKGESAVVLTDSQTIFERGAQRVSLKGIKTGERVVIYGTPTNGKWLARVVKLSASTPPDALKIPDAGSPQQAQEFTCPMHPEVRSPIPGKCPKCGMKLQPAGSK